MNLGFNGENWFDAMDDIAKQWVIDAIPEGEAFTLRFRADKPDFKSEDLNKLIELHWNFFNQSRTLNVIYCANIKDDTQTAFGYIQFLINAGLNVIAVEFGNEVYSGTQANFVFDVYKNWFEPLRLLMETNYPQIPCLVFLAPRAKDSGVLGGRNDHKTFNDAAIAYINSKSNLHPTVHIYLNDRECPVTATPINKVQYVEGTLYPELDTFYTTLYNQASEQLHNLWESTLNYIKYNCPEKELHITEWGFDNYGDIKNTLSTGAIAWWIWNLYGEDKRITSLLQHNGISMAGPGMIFPVHPKNDTPSEGLNKRRVDYWLYKLYRSLSNKKLYFETITEPGTYYGIINIGIDLPVFTKAQNVVEISTTDNVIKGEFMYSSSGATEWMAKGSTPSYEVDNIYNEVSDISIGYREITVDVLLPINVPPVAIMSGPSVGYINNPATFDSSLSYDEDGNIVSTVWYDENGQVVSESRTFVFTPNVAKTYSFILVVTDDKGSKDEFAFTYEVKPRIIKPRPWYCSVFPWLKSCKV